MARREKLISVDQIDSLIAAAEGQRLTLRDRAILELLYSAGIRVGELVKLDVQDLDLQGGFVTVLGKGKRVRTVPIGRRCVEALSQYLAGRVSGWAFLNNRGARMNTRLVRRIVDKYARKAALNKISPHTLRHSMASHMLHRGAYLFDVKELLGHALAKTTSVYLHEMPRPSTTEQVYRATHPHA